ncbi:hypothetical protein ADIS_3108 [Lunatimonas lonarensis]|uniref:alpha-L-rhamnosidase n=1 Tax=Lunatimonas lonarensis TaxID=1232681 RepID=R7ZRI7_9BACT|nr:alpha-L-rhamnosidase N-terminal domain-containing protein [Lunatimonas lonarensis]EON76658.1 hypothetical protein ADIS_3108 [Lunatimonas lonarensis]
MSDQYQNTQSRRAFIRYLSATGAVSLMPFSFANAEPIGQVNASKCSQTPISVFPWPKRKELDLSPALWIWYPAERILPNSFFHFRRVLRVEKPVKSAIGWIQGESRYLLFLNGRRIQFGPGPSDPRFSEADPIDFSTELKLGENIIASTLVYFGFGDGTWPAGKAGFIFKLELEFEDGEKTSVVSDGQWSVQQAKSWPAGKYKRWYLRALQEEFDNRLYPVGWKEQGFVEDASWMKAKVFSKAAHMTALSSSIPDYLYDSGGNLQTQLRKRSVPPILERHLTDLRLKEAHTIRWKTSVEEYFDFKTDHAFEPGEVIGGFSENGKTWVFDSPKASNEGLVLAFEWEEQAIGWPYFTIDCSEGTTVELMVQQAHALHRQGGPALINNHFNSWTRFICKEGENRLITFDYESVKWIQLHIHKAKGAIKVSEVGLLRRLYDFPAQPQVGTSDEGFNKLLKACINTVWNNSHETIVDCVGRERQQYSGDIGHMLHALHVGFGETRLPARFVDTYSQGMTLDGFFMDSWPAYDRLNRLAQRQLDLTPWGVLLDHSVGFCFDCWHHYLYTGNKSDLEEAFPRLLRFYAFIKNAIVRDGLLPVENLGVNAVWMDTDSYKVVRDKKCAYNLYVASMLKCALSKLAGHFGDKNLQKEMLELADQLAKKVEETFFMPSENLLIVNLPWLKEDGEMRTCERSLAHWILGGFAPERAKTAVLHELTQPPKRLGRCYPANAIWTYWAVSALGNTEFILADFEKRWLTMLSVRENNTIQENWTASKDTQNQLSHAGIAPFFAAYMCFAGISVVHPEGSLIRIRPQPASLEKLTLVYHTPFGPLSFESKGQKGRRVIKLSIPKGATVQLLLPSQESIPKGTERDETSPQKDLTSIRLSGDKVWSIPLRHV